MSAMKRWWMKLVTRSVYLFLIMVTLSLLSSGSIFGFKVAVGGWLIGTAVFAIVPAVVEVITFLVMRANR